MPVRHLVDVGNVDDDGSIVDPTRARHGVLRAGALLEVAGPVDPLTHVNRDFLDHCLGDCAIVERLEPGAPAVVAADGRLAHARTRPDAMRRLGRVDLGARRQVWLDVHRRRREDAACAPR